MADRLVLMPNEVEIQHRLNTVFNDAHVQRKLIPLIVKTTADRRLSGPGIIIKLRLAIQDYSSRYPNSNTDILQLLIEAFMEVLLDDNIAKHEARQFVRTYYRNTPTSAKLSATQLSETDKKLLMQAIKHITDIYDEYVDEPATCQPYRNSSVNPRHHQTYTGLFLESYYGKIHRLWTPWGSWRFAATLPPQSVNLNGFLSRLTLLRQALDGTANFVYAVLAIDKQQLPIPRLANVDRFMPYEQCLMEWQQLFNG